MAKFNLKEAFRYQNFLNSLMGEAASSLVREEHCLVTTKEHLRSKTNPDETDEMEIVEPTDTFFANDDVMIFAVWLIGERKALADAIGKAKASIIETESFDLDAVIETNKFRRSFANALKRMLRYTPKTTKECGTAYKFNAEGNQAPYYYELKTTTEYRFDKENARQTLRDVISDADETSALVDAALVNTIVDYTPQYNVNDSFKDVMGDFVESDFYKMHCEEQTTGASD